MYSESFTNQSVRDRARAIHWKPTRHSIRQVEKANTHFKSLEHYNDKGEWIGWTRALSSSEEEYIHNERELCKLDFRYFSSRYCFILDMFGVTKRFTPNIAQRIALDVMATLEQMRVAIVLMFLKARQLGITTLAQLLLLHLIVFTINLRAVTGSSDPKRSLKMFGKFQFAYDRLPVWLKPSVSKWSEGDFYKYSHGAFVDIAWGNKQSDIGRGDTSLVAHLSELADFENAAEKIDAALGSAMHENPSMLFIAESTAKGMGNWWHETWEESVSGKEDGTGYFYPIFLPWYVGRDLYPTEARLRRFPVPEGWQPPQDIVDHARNAKEFVRDDPLLRRYLGEDWEMPIEQQWYYYTRKKRFKKKNKLADFYKEMPATPMEAFTTPFGGLFDVEQIIELQNTMRRPECLYAVEGPEIVLPVKPQEIDNAKPIVQVTVNWSNAYPSVTYKFIPLKPSADFNNKLVIYESPLENEEYIAGVDTSHGKEKDASVINIDRMWSPQRLYREQVAVFASNQVSNSYLGPFSMAIGTFYSTLVDGQQRQCKFAIEIGMGDPVQDYMRDRGWWNFHRRVQSDSLKPNVRTAKIGFSTDRYSRHNMMSEFSRAILERMYRINHPVLLQEMGSLVWNHEKKRLEAMPSAHDDHWMAAGFGYISGEQFETVQGRTSIWQAREEKQREQDAYPEYDFGDFGRIDRGSLAEEW